MIKISNVKKKAESTEMKRLIAVILSMIAICFMLTGCDNSTESDMTDSTMQKDAAEFLVENPVDSSEVHEEEYDVEGTSFIYGDKEYDLRERNSMINAVMRCTPVSQYIIIESHTGPRHAVYSIFNTETQEFEKDIIGANLIFYNDDVSTILYSFWSDVYDYDGVLLYSCELVENEFIRSLSYTEDHTAVEVTVENDEDLRTETFELP